MNTQSNTTQNPANDQSIAPPNLNPNENLTASGAKGGKKSVLFALSTLALAGCHHLDKSGLECLANLDEDAINMAQNLSSALAAFGEQLHGNLKEEEEAPSTDQMAALLFSVSYQMDVLAGLLHVSQQAKSFLLKPELAEFMRETLARKPS
ncbi:hypothetical protein [Methylovulum miyakonense]|uniref:hypothetical protein n=1 Tax=Methylovulum miyakonense TaxID=645578 RepID=UPI00036F9C10|nr:hypothetical protein [Methylovulum miyakonense]